MSPNTSRQQNAQAENRKQDEPADGSASAVPDEDGPHDVPDEQVIEKTLPAPGSVRERAL